MMKRMFFVLTFFISVTVVKSQVYLPFPDSGAVWSVLVEGASPVTPYQYNYMTFTLAQDTVIGSYTYRKIFASGLSGERGGLREDTLNQRIYLAGYFLFNYTDTLLYDFNLTVGDTAYTDMMGEVYVVYDVDSVLILGQFRKRLQMSSPFGRMDEWIVGIGSTNHPLKPLLPTEFEGNYTLMCLQDDTAGVYIRYSVPSNNGPWYAWLHPGNCGLLNVQTPSPTQPLLITIDNKTLSVNAPMFIGQCTYVIVDINGKEIKRLETSNSAQIQMSELSDGVYILQVTDLNGRFSAQKFVLY